MASVTRTTGALGSPRSRRVSEHVAAEILRYIDERSLKPGERIGTEEALAREFGVSRPTLREALRTLSTGDLVRATKGPGGGIFVANTVEEGLGSSISGFVTMLLETRRVSIEELLEARSLLEVPLTGLAALRIDDLLIKEVREAIDLSRDHLHDGEVLLATDRRIHHALARAGGNPVVEAFMGWTFDVLQPSLKSVIAPAVHESEIVEQHAAILRALERHDPVRAERAMREHLDYIRDLVRAVGGGEAWAVDGAPASASSLT